MKTLRELTEAERRLLGAVVKVLDLPNADYDGLRGRADTLNRRANLIIGALSRLDSASLESILQTLEAFAAEPLDYGLLDEPVRS